MRKDGSLSLPKTARERLGLKPGDTVEVAVEELLQLNRSIIRFTDIIGIGTEWPGRWRGKSRHLSLWQVQAEINVFVDTGGWYAIVSKVIAIIAEGVNYYRQLLNEGVALLTSGFCSGCRRSRACDHDISHSVTLAFLSSLEEAANKE